MKSRSQENGFTLQELLAVIGLIALLASLLVPVIGHARFRARVATCANNYRQWGIAVALYATEDGKGRLPSFPLPIEKMSQYSTLEPWFVPFALVTNMAAHGVTVPMWFCPLRQRRFETHRENFRRLTGDELITPEDLVKEYQQVQHASFAFPDLFWWVPRRLGGFAVEYPDPKLMKTRVPEQWPSKMDDATVATMPFISDWTTESTQDLGVTGGGHRWGGKLRNNNAGFADGHVETRPVNRLQWQAKSPDGVVYLY